jgi:hypothetical protein
LARSAASSLVADGLGVGLGVPVGVGRGVGEGMGVGVTGGEVLTAGDAAPREPAPQAARVAAAEPRPRPMSSSRRLGRVGRFVSVLLLGRLA